MRGQNLIQQNWKTPSKWILAGEHAVLRGSEALVFPLHSRSVHWELKSDGDPFRINASGTTSSEIEIVFWSALERACVIAGIDRHSLSGQLNIDCNIPFGMGLGASASLAVGLAKLLEGFGFLGSPIKLAHEIENLFHGESSGVDVSVVFHNLPMVFRRNQNPFFLQEFNLPHLSLSHCGRRGPTKDCIHKVNQLFVSNLAFAQKIDNKMAQSVQLFKEIISKPAELKRWKEAIDLSQSCFLDWGLVPEEAEAHINLLKSNGAIACKMTGSGDGGFVLSLWESDVNFKRINSLIPII